MNPDRRPVITHLTTVHAPADVRIYLRECRTLAAAGYRVILLAPRPRPGESVPGAPVDYRPLPRLERRVPRMLYSLFGLPFRALALRADCFHFHDPELIPAGLLLKLCRRRVIWDVHENTAAQVAAKHYLGPLAKAILTRGVTWLEWVAARCFDAAVCATPGIAQRVTEAGGRAHVVRNYPMQDEFPETQPGQVTAGRRRDVVYVGSLMAARGVTEMVQAMGCLPEDLDCRLRLAGPVAPADLLDACSTLAGWERVDYLGLLSRTGVVDLLRTALAGMMVLWPTDNHLASLPNKLFEYMAAGLPVIASDFPRWRQLVADCGCGLNVDAADPEAIARAIRWIYDHPEEAAAMGERGRRLVQERCNWGQEAPALLRAYADVLGA